MEPGVPGSLHLLLCDHRQFTFSVLHFHTHNIGMIIRHTGLVQELNELRCTECWEQRRFSFLFVKMFQEVAGAPGSIKARAMFFILWRWQWGWVQVFAGAAEGAWGQPSPEKWCQKYLRKRSSERVSVISPGHNNRIQQTQGEAHEPERFMVHHAQARLAGAFPKQAEKILLLVTLLCHSKDKWANRKQENTFFSSLFSNCGSPKTTPVEKENSTKYRSTLFLWSYMKNKSPLVNENVSYSMIISTVK